MRRFTSQSAFGRTGQAVLAGLVLLMMGCGKGERRGAATSNPDDPLAGSIGQFVSVQFRRDALGTAAALPVPPKTSSMNGAETSISGKLLLSNDDSVTIETESRRRWIPKSVILLIEYQAP